MRALMYGKRMSGVSFGVVASADVSDVFPGKAGVANAAMHKRVASDQCYPAVRLQAYTCPKPSPVGGCLCAHDIPSA